MAVNAAGKTLCSVDFEVFGKVQGVFFRKDTRRTALEHSLVGWVMNTSHKTVVGQLQGEKASVHLMKKWLKETGSPKSKIDRCKFSNEKTISSLEFSTFTIRK
ncbi:acylphosphatase-2-like [Acropora muricata]|uniref:acylphosphatase-2-like n=1 Tax=Acropora muricata TaxID=159855 RepID=UPI0034E5AE8B